MFVCLEEDIIIKNLNASTSIKFCSSTKLLYPNLIYLLYLVYSWATDRQGILILDCKRQETDRCNELFARLLDKA